MISVWAAVFCNKSFKRVQNVVEIFLLTENLCKIVLNLEIEIFNVDRMVVNVRGLKLNSGNGF
jgi:hypothetical protein